MKHVIKNFLLYFVLVIEWGIIIGGFVFFLMYVI